LRALAAAAADAADRDALEGALAAACARGQAAFPDLAHQDTAFARDLARILKVADPAALAPLAVEDLFLSSACLARVPGAVERFRARHRETIRAAVARIVPAADVDELEQQLLDQLLLGSASAQPKVAGYAGRAPLDRWIAVAAQRAALMRLRERRAEERARSAAAREVSPGDETHPETAFLKRRYRDDFQQALAEALARLPDRERLLFRLHLVNGVSLEKIGKMFSVTQPTVSRWLAAAREAVREDMKKALAARLGASSAEIASLAAMVASGLDLSISAILRGK
jgi:RNA polymerase sigma-70 factor (ECF subfamily)